MEQNLSKQELEKLINAYGFAAHDWGLYLDTHPTDAGGIRLHAEYSQKARELAAEYTAKYGPLRMSEPGRPDFFSWIENPWPWEPGANRFADLIKGGER